MSYAFITPSIIYAGYAHEGHFVAYITRFIVGHRIRYDEVDSVRSIEPTNESSHAAASSLPRVYAIIIIGHAS